MSRLPPYTPAQVAKILEENGFRQLRQKGSHVFYGFGSRVLTISYAQEGTGERYSWGYHKAVGTAKKYF